MIAGKASPLAGSGLWIGAATAITLVHVAVGWVLLSTSTAPLETEVPGAIMIELAPVAVARADVPPEVAPGPLQEQSVAAPDQLGPVADRQATHARPEPREEFPPRLPQSPDPAVALDDERREPDKKQQAEARPQSQASLAAPTTSAPQIEAEQKGSTATTTAHGTGTVGASATVARWADKVVRAIERCKRYPAEASARREEGLVLLSFTMDRQGSLGALHILNPSGSEILDRTALDIVKRCAPFPPPPEAVPGNSVPLSIPIRFRFPRGAR